MANFNYSTSWGSDLKESDAANGYDLMDSSGYYYYWGDDGKLRDEQNNIVDADGNIVSSSSDGTVSGGKSGLGSWLGQIDPNILIGTIGDILTPKGGGNNNSGGGGTTPRVGGGAVTPRTNTLPNSGVQGQPIVTTTKKWILPVAIGGGILLVGVIAILVLKKSK